MRKIEHYEIKKKSMTLAASLSFIVRVID